jgi:hypothetical protein
MERFELDRASALNRQLEITFVDPQKGRPKGGGVDCFTECGRGLEAVVDAFQGAFESDDARGQKWIADLSQTAIDAYKAVGKLVSSFKLLVNAFLG